MWPQVGFLSTLLLQLFQKYGQEFNNSTQLITTSVDDQSHVIPIDYFTIIEATLILFLTIFLNNVLLPLMPGINMRRRIGMGISFFLASGLVAMLLEGLSSYAHLKIELPWMIIPVILYAIGELLVVVTGIA